MRGCHDTDKTKGALVEMKEIKKDTPLTKKEQALVDEYFICGMNATEAYLRLHPNTEYNSAKAKASLIMTKVNVKAELQRRFEQKTMQAEEALARLSDFARGDFGEFATALGGIDWIEAKERGLTKLVKKWKVKTVTINGKDEDKEITTEEIELYDAKDANEKILKIHGKFVDKVDLSNKDGSLKPDKLTDEERLQRMKQLAVMIAKEMKE